MSANFPSVIKIGIPGNQDVLFDVELINEEILSVSDVNLFYFVIDDNGAGKKTYRFSGSNINPGLVMILTDRQTLQITMQARPVMANICLAPIYHNVHAQIPMTGGGIYNFGNTIAIFPYAIDNSKYDHYPDYAVIDAVVTGISTNPDISDSGISFVIDDCDAMVQGGNINIKVVFANGMIKTLTSSWVSYRYDHIDARPIVWWPNKQNNAPIPDASSGNIYVLTSLAGSVFSSGNPGEVFFDPKFSSLDLHIKRITDDINDPIIFADSIVTPGQESLHDGDPNLTLISLSSGNLNLGFRDNSDFGFQIRNSSAPYYRFDVMAKSIPSSNRIPVSYDGTAKCIIQHPSLDFRIYGSINSSWLSDNISISGADYVDANDSSVPSRSISIKPITTKSGLSEISLSINGVGIGNNELTIQSLVIDNTPPSSLELRQYVPDAMPVPVYRPFSVRCIGTCNALGSGTKIPE